MNWLSLFGRLRAPRPRRAPLRRQPSKPAFESLEDRCVPAAFNVNTLLDLPITANSVTAQGVIAGTNLVSLRSAIQAANATPGVNTINLTLPGVYQTALPNAAGSLAEDNNLTGDFDILPPPNSPGGSSLAIVNTSGGTAAVDAAGLDRAFDINPNNVNVPLTAVNTPGFSVSMQGFTIENGRALTNTNLANDADQASAGSGGGVRDVGNVSLTLTNMAITNNSAQNDGGGVAMENQASTRWTLTVTGSTISNNHAGAAGGGIDTDGAGKTVVSGSTLSGNTSTNQGAGIWLDAIQNATTNVFESSSLTVTNTTVSGNLAYAPGNVGGGIGQAGTGSGVGVIITNSTVSGNFSGGVGGGYGDENGGSPLVVVNSTFANNVSIDNGGGIEATGAITSISGSTVVGNTVQGTVNDGTNTGIGGVFVASPAFNLNNTIVAGNFSNGPGAGNANLGGTAPDIAARVTAGFGNFIGIGDANLTGITNGTGGNQVGTAAAPLFARLGPLQNNGGPTLTMAPLPGSPVIDRGVNNAVPTIDPITNAPITDQRGFLRVVGAAVDVGAVEFQSPAVTVTLTATPNRAARNQPVTLTATLTPPGAPPNNPVTGTVTFLAGATVLGTAPVTNGVATLQTTALPVGNNVQVTARYSGDVNYTAVTSAAVMVKVIAPRTVGAFDPATGTWFLRDANNPGGPNAGQFQFGGPGWQAVAGDWNGTGQYTPAVVDPTGKWYIRFSNSAGAPDITPFAFGGPGWIPLAGYWTQQARQSGKMGIGVYDPKTGTFYLRNSQGPGAPDFTIRYGAPGWIPVVGDWDGDGVDTIGVVDPKTEAWYLRNENSPGGPDANPNGQPFQFGGPGWKPVVGDWDGDGKTTIGVVDPQGNWYLRNTNNAGGVDVPRFAFGQGSWIPLAGQWDAVPPKQDALP
jgi:hypothetical protein